MSAYKARDFKDKLKAFGEKAVGQIVKDAQCILGKEIHQRVLRTTPVLTGHARHNWILSVNDMQEGEIDGVYGGKETHDPLTALEVARWRTTYYYLQSMPVGQTLWLVNNVPYILRLENDGWSSKAPMGMLKVTLQGLLEEVKSKGVPSRERSE